MTAERYYVRRASGKIFGPFDKNAIQMMLKSNKLDMSAEVSRDKEQWQRISEVPGLGQPGGAINSTITGGWSPGGDLPTPKGVSDLPRSAGSNLPRPVDSNLPRPSGISGLPRPSDANLPTPSGASLPTPASGAQLPRPAPSLPLPSSSGLPTPSASLPTPGASLPTPGASLPTPGASLPTPGASLPRPGASLPTPGASAPRSMGGFSSAAQDDDDEILLDEEDLFGSPTRVEDPEDDLFGGGYSDADEDDLFGSASDAFGVGQGDSFGDDGDSFLVGNAPPEEDDLFGDPGGSFAEDEDLFGQGPRASSIAEDDLFGDTDDDDFLGGDQGFSFLDDGSPKQAASTPDVGGGSSWGEDLLGGGAPEESNTQADASQAWEEDLLGGDASPAYSSTSAQEPPRQGQSIPSTGISQPASTGIPSATPSQPASEGPKTKETKAATSDKKRGRAALFVVPLILLALAAGGVALFNYISDNEGEKVDPVVKTKRRFNLTFEQVYAANYGEIRDYISQSKKAKLSPATQARLLFAQTILISLYDDQEAKVGAQKLAASLASDASPEAKASLGAYHISIGEEDAGTALLNPLTAQEDNAGMIANLFLGIQAYKKAKAEVKEEPKKDPPAQPADGQDMGTADMPAAAPPEPPAPEGPDAMVLLTKASKLNKVLPAYWIGRLHEKQGQVKKAIAQMNKVKKETETFVPAFVALGRIHYLRGNLNMAAENIERVLSQELSALAHPKDKGEMLHYMGLVYSARNQSELAIENFTKALEADSSRTSTLRALAEEYERAKKYREALTFFKTNTTLAQSDPDVMLGIVRAHIGLKEWVEAMEQLRAGEKQFPKNPNFPYYLGELERRRGANYEAQKALKRAVEIDPSLLMAHAQLAQLAWKVDNDSTQGEEHIKEIVARPDKIDAPVSSEVAKFYAEVGKPELAIQWYREALTRDTNFWRARLPLSRLLLEQGDTQEALKLLERARDEGVQDMRLSAYLADAYRQSKQYDRAIDEINKVLEKVPKKKKKERSEYIFIRGRVHFDRGNYETSFTDFNKAYALNPRYQDAHFYIGRTKLAQGEPETAIRIFKSVIDQKPNKGEYRYHMGVVLEQQQRFSQALDEYRKVTEKDPRYALAHPEVYITRGRLLSKLNYTQQGKEDVLRALSIAPNNINALVAIGEVEYDEKSYAKAIEHFSKALGKDPKFPSAQYKKGMSHIYLDQLVPGAQHLQQAIKHGHKDPEIYRTLGYTYRQLGNRDQARLAFETFLEKSLTAEIPSGTIKEVRKQLKELGAGK